MKHIVIPAILCAALTASCTFFQSIVHDDEVVAKVGRQKLYRSELEPFIPEGVSSLDSTNLSLAYIESWATGIIFSDKAMEQLSKEEQDMTAEIESYRRTILRFRYEQRYVADRLDTLVSEEQISDFYEAHPELFSLERPILKVRFIDISKAAEQKDEIIAKMGSRNPDELVEAEDLAFFNAIRYFDSSDTWMDAAILAREFGTDYGTMLACLSQNYITFDETDRNDVKVAYVCAIQRSGLAPLEFCSEKVRDFILNGRKRDLLTDLESRIVQDAKRSGHFVVY